MAITAVAGDDIAEAEAEAPLLNDVVTSSVDFNGRASRRSRSGCWKSASFIIGVEVAERFAYTGICSNLINYLTGPLGQSTAAAAANVNVWDGTATLLPLLGAFAADSFWGRYRTIIIASVTYILGLGFLSLSAAFHSYNSSTSPPPSEVIFFFLSLYLVAFGQGGHKPCVQAFGADQFDERDKNELKSKSSFFNWWYFSMNGGILAATLGLSYIQEFISWELGFGIPCIVMCIALLVFLLGSNTFRFRINRDERNPFLSRNKGILRLIPIWCTCLGYAIISSQAITLFTKQGVTMDRHITSTFQIPAASLQSLVSVSILLLIPIYDRILIPIARIVTGKPAGISTLQRVGAGIFLSFLIMIVAALVERQRLTTAAEHGLVDEPHEMVPMSVWWLAPQYLLLGVADVFTMVGLQEFFYDQVPGELKSLGLALYLSIFGVGSFLSSLLISIIEAATSRGGGDSWFSSNLNRAHLDYFYWLLGGVSAVTMAAYVYFAKSYTFR